MLHETKISIVQIIGKVFLPIQPFRGIINITSKPDVSIMSVTVHVFAPNRSVWDLWSVGYVTN